MSDEIILVRHGETEGNVKMLLQGGGSDVPLTAKGISQAQWAGHQLSIVPFDEVYTSPRMRTQDTAQHILELNAYRTPTTQVSPDLNEMCFGKYESEPIAEFMEKEQFAIFTDEKLAQQVGGETFKDVMTRVTSFAHELATHQADNILCVSHGMALMCLMQALVGKDKLPAEVLANASISVFDVHDGQFDLILYNHHQQ